MSSSNNFVMNDFVIENNVLTHYIGEGGDVVVPEGVTGIAGNAFNRTAPGNNFNAVLRTIQLPSSLKTIGPNALCWCNIKIIDIPEGVVSIGHKAFNKCSLSEIRIPDSVYDIGSEAFKDTPWLRAREKEKNVFAGKVLLYCRGSESEVVIETGTVGVAGEAFAECPELKKVLIPQTVKYIGNRAFADCGKLEQAVVLGDTVIGKDCFPENAAVVASKLLVDKAKGAVLKKQLFLGSVLNRENHSPDPGIQKYLKKNFPDLLEEFRNRPELLECAVEKGLLSAEQVAVLLERFSGDASKCAVLLSTRQKDGGSSPAQVNTDPFREPSVAELKAIWKTANLPDSTIELSVYKGTEIEIRVPQKIGKKQVSKIGSKCFAVSGQYGNNHLLITSVVIPEGIIKIGGMAFQGCVNLKEITLPSGLTAIEGNAFYDCAELYSLTLPDSVKSIGYAAFYNCKKLSEIKLPNGIEAIDDYAFWGCDNLQRIHMHVSLKTIGADVFHGCKNLTIYGSSGSIAEQYAKEHNIPFVGEE